MDQGMQGGDADDVQFPVFGRAGRDGAAGECGVSIGAEDIMGCPEGNDRRYRGGCIFEERVSKRLGTVGPPRRTVRHSRTYEEKNMKRLMAVCAVVVLFAFCFVRAEVEEGFTSLFNGKDLTGWVYGKTQKGLNKSGEGYRVENGAIYCTLNDGGNLYTEKEYSDFVLRFEFKLT